MELYHEINKVSLHKSNEYRWKKEHNNINNNKSSEKEKGFSHFQLTGIFPHRRYSDNF